MSGTCFVAGERCYSETRDGWKFFRLSRMQVVRIRIELMTGHTAQDRPNSEMQRVSKPPISLSEVTTNQVNTVNLVKESRCFANRYFTEATCKLKYAVS